MNLVSKKVFCFFLLALGVAVLISPFASSAPDGLERVAHELGFLDKAAEKVFVESPIPDYLMPGVENERGATALAGFIGTVLTFGVIYGLGKWLGKTEKRVEG